MHASNLIWLTIVLTNGIGLTEEPLEVVKPLKNMEITEGEPVNFVFEVSKPGYRAVWSYEDKTISVGEAGYELSSVEGCHTLTLPSAELTNAGKYKIKVDNCHSSADLTVRGNHHCLEDIVFFVSNTLSFYNWLVHRCMLFQVLFFWRFQEK